MPYASSLSTTRDTLSAADSVVRQVLAGLQGAAPQLAFLFMTHPHSADFQPAVARVQEALGGAVLLGCAGESVAGGDAEIEGDPAVSLWAADLPGASIESFHLAFRSTADGIVCDGFPEFNADETAEIRAVLVLGEPFTTAPDFLIEQFADTLPGIPVVGGMASGGLGPGQNRLFYRGECLEQGAIGVIVRGGPAIKSIVSQGCRQIGHTYVVTKSEKNVILELGGKPALERLQETWQEISGDDQRLVQQGLHVGIVMNEYQDTFKAGDFLIANVLGADRETGSIAIGSLVRTGQTVQFHVRDAKSADEELRHLLERETQDQKTGAALLFSCNGRGTRLFSEPHHDARLVHSVCGAIPLAGFFAQGEFGPVGKKNYVHGFTASIALFERT